MTKFEQLLRALAACLFLLAAPLAQADAGYPDRTVRLVVPWPAGGVTDTFARLIAEELRKELGQAVVVESIGGGAGIIGSSQVARARADGYTLLFVSNAHTVNAVTRPKLPFDTVDDFQPLMLVASSPNMLVVSAGSDIATLKDYLARARAKPGSVSFGASNGTSSHFAGEQFASMAGIQTLSVPYGVTSQVATAVLSGEVASAWISANTALPLIKAGRMRALGIASETRSPLAPDVPTFREQGFEQMLNDSWFGILGPAKMPPAVVKRLDEALAAATSRPEIRERMAELGFTALGLRLNDFTDRMRQEIKVFSVIARERGISVN